MPEPTATITIELFPSGRPGHILVQALSPEQLQGVLESAAHVHLKDELAHGHTADDIISVEARIIDAPEAVLGFASALYGHDKVRAVQVVWPDDNMLFPAQDGKMVIGGTEVEQPLYGPIWWT